MRQISWKIPVQALNSPTLEVAPLEKRVMSNPIKVTCAADKNFFRFIPSMINGLVQNTAHDVIVGVFTQGVKQKYKDKLCALFPKVEFHFWDISQDTFQGLPFKLSLSPISYARVVMADLSGWDKFVYLDVDIAITGDIAELYNTDIGDAYLGACIISNNINAGILVINGKAWRQHNIRDKVLKFAAEHQPKEADQAAIEAVCSGKISTLAPKWNIIIDPIWGRVTLKPEYYQQAAITHYITGFKPWNLGYYLLPHELKNRYTQYVIKAGFPIDWKRELTLFLYQVLMLFKVFVLGNLVHKLGVHK